MANNSNKKWKPEEKKSSIRSKAQKEKISLKPTNQSPYDRKYSISKQKEKK